MKKLLMTAGVATAMIFTSCTNRISTLSKNSVNFPGMTVTRADYKLSKDVSAELEVKEWSTLFGLIHPVTVVGEQKNEKRFASVFGFGLGPAEQIAAYRLLEANPSFDYLTNIRISREFTRKWLFLFTRYNSKVKIVAKGITLNTEK